MGADTIPARMLACQVIEFKTPYKIHEIDVPDHAALHPTDMLVKLAVASLCHTDSMVSNGVFGTALPCTASHEGAGTVVAVGSGVRAEDFRPGTRVMVGIPYHACGRCGDCRGPDVQYCKEVKHTGVTRDGCFAQYVVADSLTSAPLPDNVSFETAAPLACAGCTIYRGVLASGCGRGDRLAIIGSGGGLGHLGIQFAKARGIRVLGVDARDDGLALSREAGADAVLDARAGEERVVEEVKRWVVASGGDGEGGEGEGEGDEEGGVKATLVVSEAPGAAAMACKITRMHGTVVQIAQPTLVEVPFAELVFRDIRVKGSLICNPAEAREMLQVVAKHGISVKTNAVRGLEEVPKLLDLARSGKIKGKGIVIIDQEQIDRENSQGIEMH